MTTDQLIATMLRDGDGNSQAKKPNARHGQAERIKTRLSEYRNTYNSVDAGTRDEVDFNE